MQPYIISTSIVYIKSYIWSSTFVDDNVILVMHMSYDIGTSIDISYLNRKVEVVSDIEQKPSGRLFDVGTHISFRLIGNKLKSARHIPVAFA